MDIKASEIKKLREETGAGIMDAKKALQESGGDMDKAKKLIAAKGIEKAEKKADRETGVGRVFGYVHFNGKTGAMVRLSCETDFVAKTEDFEKLGKEIAMQVASMAPESIEDLSGQAYLRNPQLTIGELVKELSGKTGENVQITAIARL